MAGLSWRLPANPAMSDMMPTRPRNMAEHNTSSELSESSGVAPSDDPTVKRAERVSKIRA